MVSPQKRGGRWAGVVAEGGGVDKGGNAVPLVVLGHQNGADEVLVEFDGQDRVEFGGIAEGYEV